jgi:hypothetical protein
LQELDLVISKKEEINQKFSRNSQKKVVGKIDQKHAKKPGRI